MRGEKVWTVAAKEMAEFKSNKYIVFSLVLPPILIAVVLPLALLAPLAGAAPDTEPLPIDPPIDQIVRGETLVGRILANHSIVDSVVLNSVIRNSRIENTTMDGVSVEGSVLVLVTLQDSVVRDSNIIEPKAIEQTTLVNSPIIGGSNGFQEVLLVILDSFLLFFLILPAAIPALIASYTFVGEKLNKSLEPLLATPTTDVELLTGKALSIFLPTMGVTWLAAGLFILLANALLTPSLGFAPLPTPSWLLGVVLVAPLFCTLSITFNVIVSSRVNDVRASQQLGTLVILPVLFLFMSSIFGVFQLGVGEILLFAGAILVINVVVGYIALQLFNREEILVSWK